MLCKSRVFALHWPACVSCPTKKRTKTWLRHGTPGGLQSLDRPGAHRPRRAGPGATSLQNLCTCPWGCTTQSWPEISTEGSLSAMKPLGIPEPTSVYDCLVSWCKLGTTPFIHCFYAVQHGSHCSFHLFPSVSTISFQGSSVYTMFIPCKPL